MITKCEFSHLGGSEILQKKYPDQNEEINKIIERVIGEKSKICEEKNRKGQEIYSPTAFRTEFKEYFEENNYDVLIDRFTFNSCDNSKVKGYKKIDYYKNKVGIQVQFGKYSFMTYDMAKFQYLYNQNKIDIGVEILPSHRLQKSMSSGMAYGELLINDLKILKKHFPVVPIKVIVVDVEK